MPAAKVSPEIAAIRGVPVHEKCISPPHHSAFSTPRELIEFLAELRDIAEGPADRLQALHRPDA